MPKCVHGKDYEVPCDECEKEVEASIDPLNTGIFSGINARVAK